MINEHFLQQCFYLLFNKHSIIEKNQRLYSDILNIIESVEEQYKGETFTRSYETRCSFLKLFIKRILSGKTKQQVLQDFNFDGIFKELKEFLDFSSYRDDIPQKLFEEAAESIDLARTTVTTFKNIPVLKKLVDDYESNAYNNISEFNERAEDALNTLNKNRIEAKRNEILNKGGCFSVVDGVENNMSPVLENIARTYDPKNKIPTGFPLLDEYVLNGGFNNKAVYVYAGAAKSGKSTLLSNQFINCLKKKLTEKKIFVYITLENTLEQAYPRLFCAPLGLTINEFQKRVSEDKEKVKADVVKILSGYPNVSEYDYKPSKSITVADLYAYLNNVYQKHGGKYKIGGVFIDYLLHLKPSSKSELRIQLGEMIQELTTLAIHFDCPVVTAHQLNREHTKVKSPDQLHVGLVGESHLITCHVDSLFLMAKDIKNSNVVHFNTGVQRNGKSDVCMSFDVDFDKFEFKNLRMNDPDQAPLDTCVRDDSLLKFESKKKPLDDFCGFAKF
jgi:replicative DNA helicase